MIEKITRISNPLTIIAIFAALAEIASSIALVALPESTQSVFVWFCMVFPILLVVSFFIVLYRKPKVLYAPSDFKDEKNFISILDEKYLNLEKKFDFKPAVTINNVSENVSVRPNQQLYSGESPKELLEKAASEEESEKTARLLAQLLINKDSTASELEAAGDLARKSGRRSLASDLYKLSSEKEPERISSQIEYLAVRAEIDAPERQGILGKLVQLALSNLTRNNFARVANSLMEFDLYDELAEFSEQALNSDKSDSVIKSLAYRNLGVAYKESGKNDKAIENFEKALEGGGNNENVLRPYIRLLMELGKNKDVLTLARKLVEQDFSSGTYHRFLIEALLKNGMEDEAKEHLLKVQSLGLLYG